MPHLLVDISAHGFGHVSQAAPVVNELARRVPGLRVTLRTTAPNFLLQQRFHCDLRHIHIAFDFGMQMANAVDVQVEESAVAYREFHADWDEKVEREAHAMRALKPDLLLANVPYLSLAAARVAGVRAVGMCSLNWADIYHHYCAASRTIHAQMLEAYNSAECFLKVQPAMPMPDFTNARNINLIAQAGCNQRPQLVAKLRLDEAEKLVLVAMGGMKFRLPVERWPHLPGVRWIIPQAWQVQRNDMAALESLGLPFGDVLASCDAVLTKPGYGTFAEAACDGVPVLYVARRDWPEEPYLVQWLSKHGVCLEVQRDALYTGNLGDALNQLWAIPKPTAPVPSGINEAADYLAALF
ncbi:MAG: hypothetical protein HY937_01705 [Nitrosomonadales bacterium]|nr:hypothetical protein [Nitrosomonadales bacterium]